MKFDPPLSPGRLVRRYKRFLADVEPGDEPGTNAPMTVHCANPGSMMGLAKPGFRVWLADSRNPKRKLRHTWELVETDGGALVGVNTARANPLVEEALRAGAIAELSGFEALRREVPYGKNSRVDFLLESAGDTPLYIEVKSVTLSRRAGVAEFPDAKTARGAKHLDELSDVVRQGGRAVMLFLVQRDDCDTFAVAADIDPAYAERLASARQAGVETLCYCCRMSPEEIRVAHKLDWAPDDRV